jgi:hypothetical protein
MIVLIEVIDGTLSLIRNRGSVDPQQKVPTRAS